MVRSNTQIQIIKSLQHGGWVSGSQLATSLNVSRTAIWKHMNALLEHSIPVEKHPKKGYRFTEPLYLLDEHQIRNRLLPAFASEMPEFYLLHSTKSTNLFCRHIDSCAPWIICCSEEQTAGKGRLGRKWNSPFAQNIYCSVRWTYQGALEKLSGLSLVVSLALHRALSVYLNEEQLQIKWPNDILYSKKKLAGILIEIYSEPHNAAHVIIGFGINVNTDTCVQPLSERAHCSMRDGHAQCYDRNLVLSDCLNALHKALQDFLHYGLEPLLSEWKPLDALLNQPVTIHQHTTVLQGIARGISPQGHLQLETTSGIIDICAGDATLRDTLMS